MASEDPGDPAAETFTRRELRGARFEWVDLSDSTFRFSDLTGARMRGVSLANADLDGEIEGLRIRGVEVAPLIEAELDRLHPERAARHAKTPAELQEGWDGLQRMWTSTIERVKTMPPETIHISVDGEWPFAKTLRHLLLATDAWLNLAVLRKPQPFHPLGVLFGSYSGREAEYGLDAAAEPTFDEILEARAGRVAMVRDFLAQTTPEELASTRSDPWGEGWEPTVLDCIQVVFEEEWHHHRYAVRDLAAIEAGQA